MHRSRRAFCCLGSAALVGAALPLRLAAQTTAGNEDAAWALWAEVMECLKTHYYQPVDELALTTVTANLLSQSSPGTGAKSRSARNPTDLNETTLLLRETVLRLANTRTRPQTPVAVMEKAVALLCDRHLHFSRYETAADRSAGESLGKADLGMRIEVSNGRYLCIPRPGEAAELAGIQPGDEMIAIGGVPVDSLSRGQIRTRIYGDDGTAVEIRVQQAKSRILTAKLVRKIPPPSRITLPPSACGRTIGISTFEKGFAIDDLKAALADFPPQEMLTLDLRGNGGGSFYHAADTIGALAPGPRPLVVARLWRRGTLAQEVATDLPQVAPVKRILVLQDKGTASAAELVAAALSEIPSLRVTVGGAASFGKDTAGDEFAIAATGGVLRTTTGNLTTASGKGWAQGIKPTFG